MPERITLAIDGGVASAAALEWTLARAATTEVEMRLMMIDGSASPTVDSQEQLEAGRVLDEAAARFAESSPQSKIATMILRGEGVERLIRESESADLIVIGSRPTGVVAGIFNATLPLAIASRSWCPVVIVPSAWIPSTGPVVVGIDEPTSVAAHEFAACEAERLGRDLVLVRAWELPPMVTTAILGAGTVDDAIRQANAELLETAASGIGHRHESLPLQTKLSYATPSRALVAGAESIELVVIGTHHRHALAEWMLGSVGHDLVMHLPCPVAIVPPVEPADSSAP